MRFLINTFKAFHCVSIALFLVAGYAMIFQSLIWSVFVIAAYALAWGTKQTYMEMEQEIKDTIAEIQDSIKSYCNEVLECGNHSLELPINGKFYTIRFYYFAEIRETIGASHMGDYEMLQEISNEYISIVSMECKDESDEIYDCGFTIKDIQEGL